jgi:hypothetical protein
MAAWDSAIPLKWAIIPPGNSIRISPVCIAPLSQAEWEAGEEVRLTGANSSKEEECLSI